MPDKKIRLLVESLSARLARAQAILLVISEAETRIEAIRETVKTIKETLQVPVSIRLANRIEEVGTLEYSNLTSMYDLVIGLGLKLTEERGVCLLLDSRDSGAYALLIDKNSNKLRASVDMHIKTELPGVFDFILKQAGNKKNARNITEDMA